MGGVDFNLIRRYSEFFRGVARERRQNTLALKGSLYTLLQIFSITLFEKIPLPRALLETANTFEQHQIYNQLNLFSF